MIILKIIGIVLLSIIALIFAVIIFALCVKVKILLEYSDDNTSVKIKWLFLTIPLYPSDNNKSNKDNKDKTEASDAEAPPLDLNADATPEENSLNDTNETSANNTPKPKQKNTLLNDIYNSHGIDGLILILKKIFSYFGSFVGDMLKSLVIEELYVDVMCNKGDAAQTAIYYGEVSSLLFPILGSIVSKCKVRKYDIEVYPDFLAKHSSVSFIANIHLFPINVVKNAIVFVFRLIFKVFIGFFVKIFKYKKNLQNSKNLNSSALTNN